jgi:hypothetical protein
MIPFDARLLHYATCDGIFGEGFVFMRIAVHWFWSRPLHHSLMEQYSTSKAYYAKIGVSVARRGKPWHKQAKK